MKSMDDKEIQDHAWSRMLGDLDGIESHSIFDEQDNPAEDPHKGVKLEAHGVSVELKPMAGEQSPTMPKFEPKKEEQEGEFGE